jgi:hypothetical protein
MPLPNPRRPEAHLRLPIGLAEEGKRLRDLTLCCEDDLRARRAGADFTCPREQALSSAFAARFAKAGRLQNPGADFFHRLTLADRHWLAATLLLREGITLLQAPIACRACGEILELQLALPDALAAAEPVLRRSARSHRNGLRLPTAADLEEARNAPELARLCAGPDAALDEVESRLQNADPLCVVEMNGNCCTCGSGVRAQFDVAGLWLGSQRKLAEELLQCVHTLARTYHWSEHEILSMPESRRRAYWKLCRADRAGMALEEDVYE